MITRKHALIGISGTNQDTLTRVLDIVWNMEGISQIQTTSEIQTVWGFNKTPVINAKDFMKICADYNGNILIFNVETKITSLETKKVVEAFTKFCYDNLIEPGEFKVPNTANNSSEGCFLCEIAKHPEMTTFEHNMECKFVDMVVYETDNFVVIPGLGPLDPGYLMIMPKEHYLSSAQVPEEQMQEYHEVEEDVYWMLKKTYGEDTFFYEHGTAPGGAVGLKSIVHAHVHCMIANPIDDYYKNMYRMRPVKAVKDLGQVNYFAYKDGPNGEIWACDDLRVYIQRQVHRQIRAEAKGLPPGDFNWRTTAFANRTKQTIWQMFMFLRDSYYLPERIKNRTQQFVDAARERFEEEETLTINQVV